MFVKFQTRADNQEETVLINNAKKKSENKCNIWDEVKHVSLEITFC